MTGPWRACPVCGGRCYWAEDAWVCDACGDEWNADHDPKFAAPGDTIRLTRHNRAGGGGQYSYGPYIITRQDDPPPSWMVCEVVKDDLVDWLTNTFTLREAREYLTVEVARKAARS